MKRRLPDLLAILAFVVISLAYFFPAALDGRIRVGDDAIAGVGAGVELSEYEARTGERTRWTNALFGGMPTYQMAPSYTSTDTVKWVEKLYRLFLPGDAALLFIMLLGFYILLRAFDFRVWLAALGAVAWAFSSYFFIIIAAGHIWKFITLAYIPPTIAGMVLVYRGKHLVGGLVTALFVALQILSNHLQMSYYFLFPMLFMAVAFGVKAWREKCFTQFAKSSAVLLVAGLIGIAINASNLYHTYQYSRETMRGKSELVKPASDNQTKSGLERSYITQWSYGVDETLTLLIPNLKGGASVPLVANDIAMEKALPLYRSVYAQIGQYWGEQPGTSGPVYVGAFVLTLFFLALFVVKGPMKWALLLATLLSLLLSWGKNFMPFTDLFLDYVPLYDKFRAVSSILVIAEFTIPLLALMGLREVMERPALWKEKRWAFIVSLALTGGVALLIALAPGIFPSFISSNELYALQNSGLEEHLTPILMNLTEMRRAILVADAWRSVAVIAIGTGLLALFLTGRMKGDYTVGAILLLCLVDMWGVNKRYLNDDNYVEPVTRTTTFALTLTDKEILADTALDYRVLNLASNTFNENQTSYHHKSIGGYHAAKLRRYQELIDAHISPEMDRLFDEVVRVQGEMEEMDGKLSPVINMLNTRWFIFPLQGGATIPLPNPHALGNAWFVDEVRSVANANEELDALGRVDLSTTAVIDERFGTFATTSATTDSLRAITLTAYEPNALTYEVESAEGGMAVFSEIYYPGWCATIDGEPLEIVRANYVLRATLLPAGSHKITFTFRPQSLKVTETIAFCALGLLLVALLAALRGMLPMLRKGSNTNKN